MRSFRDELEENDFEVIYKTIEEDDFKISYTEKLNKLLKNLILILFLFMKLKINLLKKLSFKSTKEM